MKKKDSDEKKYLEALSGSYKTRASAASEIIRLNSILNLPKGTEHFLSDLHGEYEAFSHIRRNASGAIKNKVKLTLGDELSEEEISELSTLIYYPDVKFTRMSEGKDVMEFSKATITKLTRVCRACCHKYTSDDVREHLRAVGRGYGKVIEELMLAVTEEHLHEYRDNVIKCAVRVGVGRELIIALSEAIKSLVIHRLHIVGDIFDRGPRADIILDELMQERSIDVQWGNHDVLWMGAAAGSEVCIATVLNNSMTYRNLDVIEIGYGISLRPLALFAEATYGDDVSAFMPKGDSGGNFLGGGDDTLVARMHKAISIIQFKLEGGCVMRNPDFDMNERLLLDKIDKIRGTVRLGSREYALRDASFPTVNEAHTYELTEGECEIMKYLKFAFMHSEKLEKHIRFLYEYGSIYKIHNNNLLFHGCIPMTEDGDFLSLRSADGLSGRSLMDFCDKWARKGYFAKESSSEKERGRDFLWFLWCGKNSPLAAREKIATFERTFIDNKEAWHEPKNAYYRIWQDEKIAVKILSEFGLYGVGNHIINGHIPVNRGENPIKANGRLIVIDGGFCKAYHGATGIGGYTLIYNSEGLRLLAHEPFTSKENAIENNADIISETVIFEHKNDRIRVRETDEGEAIREKITDLLLLCQAYERGEIKETK